MFLSRRRCFGAAVTSVAGGTLPTHDPAAFAAAHAATGAMFDVVTRRGALIVGASLGTPPFGTTTADMEKKIQQYAGILRADSGDPYAGRTLFQNACGSWSCK